MHGRDARIVRAGSLILPLGFALSVAVKGVPLLRHDWLWPRDHTQLWSFFLMWTSGWSPVGLGDPNPIPTGYLVAPAICAAAAIVGSFGAFALFAYLIGLLCTSNAAYLAQRLGAKWPATLAAQALLLFNPWVYNKMVAGHVLMIVAYGASINIAARVLLKDGETRRGMPLQIFLASCQLQFFLPCAFLAFIWSIARRRWEILATVLLAALPYAIGIIAYRHSLMGTPYTLAWQASQSVPLGSAMLLVGYFTHYASGIAPYQVAGLWALVALAGIGLCFKSSARAVFAGAAVAALVLFCSGVKGPVAPVYTAVMEGFKPSGLYRELYDLLGFAAIGYVALALRASVRLPGTRLLMAASAALVASLWITSPPSAWWPSAALVPVAHIDPVPNSRYALLPAFQPLSFDGSGSGADPDITIYRGNFTPINQYMPAYPEGAALASFQDGHDAAGLASLSVSVIDRRSGFEGSAVSIAGSPQASAAAATPEYFTVPNSVPELSLGSAPRVASVSDRYGAGNVFFADAPCTLWAQCGKYFVRSLRVPNASVDPHGAWVDARLMFSLNPALAQPFGGAFTYSQRIMHISPAPELLVSVRGTLQSGSGRVLSGTTQGYRWIEARGARAVRCLGACAVALEGAAPGFAAPNPPPVSRTPLAFHAWTPWFLTATAPPVLPHDAFLRYNVRYDAGWKAFAGVRGLQHVRVDGVTNGWAAGAGIANRRIVIVQLTALLQCVAQVAAYVWLVTMLVYERRRSFAPGLPGTTPA